MAEKAQENAAAMAEQSEDEPESEEGEQPDRESDAGGTPKKKAAPKKKKVTSAGMQLPEHWPWEEAKKLFLKPDVVSGDDLEVS